jgi:hypothetical protein
MVTITTTRQIALSRPPMRVASAMVWNAVGGSKALVEKRCPLRRRSRHKPPVDMQHNDMPKAHGG